MPITWPQAPAWRMQRHLLDTSAGASRASVSPADVVRRLGAVLATDEGKAELAIAARHREAGRGELARAFAAGEVIKVFAFRGAMHYLSPQDGGAYLALRAAGRQWELPSWQQHYRLAPDDWPAFRSTVRAALADGPMTVSELGAAVTRKPAYRHLRAIFDQGADTLIKPLTWLGDMSFGPPRDGRHTFQRLSDNPRWAGIWDLEAAGPQAIMSYLRSYGPATPAHLRYWLGEGLSAGRRRLQRWLAQVDDQVVPVEVDGETAYVASRDADELLATRPTRAVRLLPGHDQWVIGPGTADPHVVPPSRRSAVTRGANLVVAGGVVSGTWSVRRDEVLVSWFAESGEPPAGAITEQVDRLTAVVGRPLRSTVTAA